MSNRRCENCYYSEQCHCDKVCEEYTPVNEQSIDDEVYNMIEQDRTAFRAEWFEYIEAWSL